METVLELNQKCKINTNLKPIQLAHWMLQATLYPLINAKLKRALDYVFKRTKNELAIRDLFSDWLKDNLQERYELGINFLDGIEMIYGVRVDVGWEQELIDDAKEWISNKEGSLLAEFGDPYILKRMLDESEKVCTLTKDSFLNPAMYFAAGSAASANLKGVDGKKIRCNKTQWFSQATVGDIDRLLNGEMHRSQISAQLKFGEANKKRIFVATDFESYVPMTVIYEYITNKFKGNRYIWPLIEDKSKRKLSFANGVKLAKEKGYDLFPADLQKFDHPIPLTLIVRTIMFFKTEYVDKEPDAELRKFLQEQFERAIWYIMNTDMDINGMRFKVEGGWMSGYKLTNLFDSIFNLIIMMEVLGSLKIRIFDICTQGDDTYLIIKRPSGVTYVDIINGFIAYGVLISAKKNFMSQKVSFFIRNIIDENGTYGAALRPLNSIYFKGEGNQDEGIASLTTAWSIVLSRLAMWKEADMEKLEKMFEYIIKNSIFKGVREMGMNLIRQPQNYKIRYVVPKRQQEEGERLIEMTMKRKEDPALMQLINRCGIKMSKEEYAKAFLITENRMGMISKTQKKREPFLGMPGPKMETKQLAAEWGVKTHLLSQWFGNEVPRVRLPGRMRLFRKLTTGMFSLDSWLLRNIKTLKGKKSFSGYDVVRSVVDFRNRWDEEVTKNNRTYSWYSFNVRSGSIGLAMGKDDAVKISTMYDSQINKNIKTGIEGAITYEIMVGAGKNLNVGKRNIMGLGLLCLPMLMSRMESKFSKMGQSLARTILTQ